MMLRLLRRSSTLPKSADVVVIGGGSIGASTLYHLTKLGAKNVILLEKNKLTSGTTWHSAGLIWNLQRSDVAIEMATYMMSLVNGKLESESGISVGFISNGGLNIASTAARMREFERYHSLGKAFGINSRLVTNSEIKDIYPLVNTEGLKGGLYIELDGGLDPTNWVRSLEKAARLNGARVFEETPVTGFKIKNNLIGRPQVCGVYTKDGLIETNAIVNAAGCWAPKLAELAGLDLPMVSFKHSYITTAPAEQVKGLPNLRDHDASVYIRTQGESLQVGGFEPGIVFWDKVEDDFAFSLFDFEWDSFSYLLEGASNRIPAINDMELKNLICGPESFTPDHHPIIGEDPRLRGFFHACGLNSHGILNSGSTGLEVASQLLKDEPVFDYFSSSITRFDVSLFKPLRWTAEKSHEGFLKNYAILWPNDQPLAGRNAKRDSINSILQSKGCVFLERQGWEIPGWFNTNGGLSPVKEYDYYGNNNHEAHANYSYNSQIELEHTYDLPEHQELIQEECMAIRNNVGVIDMSCFGKLYLIGKDAKIAADWMFTNEIPQSPKVVYTCLCNDYGGVEGDVTVTEITNNIHKGFVQPTVEGDEQAFYIAIGALNVYHVKNHLQKAIEAKGFNARIIDVTSDMGMLSVQGRKSKNLLASLVSTSLDDIPFSTQRLTSIAGKPVRLMRVTFVGELGFEIHVDMDDMPAVYDNLFKVGVKYGLRDVGYRALNSLSAEKGYRHWHADLRSIDTPLQAGLGFTCKLNSDTEFQGKEALIKHKKGKNHLKKRLLCFTIDRPIPLLGMEAILRNGCYVGNINRGDYGYWLQSAIGYGFVQDPSNKLITKEYIESGEWSIERLNERMPAAASLKSPFDPSNNRVKGVYN